MTIEQPHLQPNLSASPPAWSTRQIIQATLVVGLVMLGFWLLLRLYLALFSLFIAIVIATAISPVVDWLYRRGLSRALGVGLVYLSMVAALIGLAWFSAPPLAEQAANIVQGSSSYYLRLHQWLLHVPSGLVQRLALELPPTISLGPPDQTVGEAMNTVAQALGYAGTLGRGLFLTVAVFLLAFFWTLEREWALRALFWLVPSTRRAEVQDLVAQAEVKVGAYVRGLVILSLIVGTLAMLGYLAIGLPYALLLGVAMGFFEALPMIGPILGTVLAVVVALSSDPSKALWVIGINILIQMTENTFLVPRVMNRAVGVNPVGILLAFAAFGSLFGLPGALLAIPIAAVLQLVLDRYVLARGGAEPQAVAGRDPLSVVQYETREFVQDVRKQIRQKPSQLDNVSDQVEEALETIAQDLESILAQAAPEKEAP